MKRTLSLYASKKLLPFLGKTFLKDIPEVDAGEIDPLYCWYADVYYLNRAKYLLICNEVSRFTFVLGPYTVDSKINFMDVLKTHLQVSLKEAIPAPGFYLDSISGYGRITQTHRGAVAFINHLKTELDYMKWYCPRYEAREFQLLNEFWRVGDTITSKNGGKDYFVPKKKFLELWDSGLRN